MAAATLNDTTVTPFAGPSAWRRHRLTRRCDRPRCGAKRKRDGKPCEAPVVWNDDLNEPRNGRCRMHGGLSTGAVTVQGRARSLANLVQFRDRPQDIGDRGASRIRKPTWADEFFERNQPDKAPRCLCGCLDRVRRRKNGNGWCSYATPSCKTRVFRQRQWLQVMANREWLHRAVVADAAGARG